LASSVITTVGSPSTISSSPILVCSALSSTLLRALEEDDSREDGHENNSSSVDTYSLEEDETIAYWKKEDVNISNSNKTNNTSPALYRASPPLSHKGKEKDEEEEEEEERVIREEVQDLVFQFDDGSCSLLFLRITLSLT